MQSHVLSSLLHARSEGAPVTRIPEPCDVLAAGCRFHAVELQAMRHEGVLSQIFAGAFLPLDIPEQPEHRAIAMSLCLPPQLRSRLLLGRFSSAWVYTGTACPPRVTALLDHRRRSGTLPPFSQIQIHEVRLGRFDEYQLGTVRLTSPLRTAIDLLFQPEGPTGWPGTEQALRALVRQPELGLSYKLLKHALLTKPRAPFRRRAEQRLERLSSVEPRGQSLRLAPVVR